jgi:YbbR domain-containing protein
MLRFIKNLFVRNWALKLLAFALALVLWLTVIPEEKSFSEKTLTIALETRNIPQNMELVEKPVPMIDVTVRAPDRLIDQVTSANVFAKLNLERATTYQMEYPLNSAMISLPAGAQVTMIAPNTVRLKLEQTKEMSLDVEPFLIGKLANGLKIDKMEVIPAKVLVRGPESKLKERDRVRTSPIDISAYTQSFEVEADLILPKPELRLATSITRVRIRIIIKDLKPATPAKK